ncbi:hypothetical protein [Paracoccus sediminilitoris]|uniref:hypothetical protein n=1 Tax=Paracoccus sediminilitoris TaxID=2202419 RepID=UPI00272A3A98|nr:hypothetical protein [Paracoccus sediminilitoris]
MTVRPTTDADILRVVDMVEPLRAAVGGLVAVDQPWIAQVGARLIASTDTGFSGAGFIAGSLQPALTSPPPVAMEHGL